MAEDPFDSDEAPAPRGGGIDPVEAILLPLWRARAWIVGAAVVGACAGGFRAMLEPNQFSSIGKFLVRTGTRESTTPESRVIGDGGGLSPISSREAVQNQIHLVNNPEVFRRVVAEVGAPTVLEPYDPTEHDDESTSLPMRWMHQFQRMWFGRANACLTNPGQPLDNCPRCVDVAEQTVSQGILVFPELGSSVLTVAYGSHSPEVAATVVDAFLRSALSHHQRVFDVDSTLQFLDEQVLKAQSASDLAEDDLARYRVECGLHDFDAQRAAILTQIDNLKAELAQNEARLAELRAQGEFLDAALAKEPQELESLTRQAPLLNPEHTYLQSRKMELRQELTRLDGSGATTREALETARRRLEDQIRQIDDSLEKAPQFIQHDPVVNSSPNPRYDSLLLSSRNVHAERLGLLQSQSLRDHRILQLEEQLDHYETCRPNLANRERAANQAKDTLERFLKKREQAALVNQLDNTQLTNLAILQSATHPRTKSGPKRGKIVLVGGALGAAAGVAFALLRHLASQRPGGLAGRLRTKGGGSPAAASDSPAASAAPGAESAAAQALARAEGVSPRRSSAMGSRG